MCCPILRHRSRQGSTDDHPVKIQTSCISTCMSVLRSTNVCTQVMCERCRRRMRGGRDETIVFLPTTENGANYCVPAEYPLTLLAGSHCMQAASLPRDSVFAEISPTTSMQACVSGQVFESAQHGTSSETITPKCLNHREPK